ncbi:MAG: hypothetical protein ACE1Z7_09165 [Woeseiaceae bacterium]
MSVEKKPFKQKALNETALALSFFFAGLVLLPLAIYFTGQSVFGEYSGAGFSDFYGRLSGEIREGRPAVWFLVLTPYLVLMLLRLTIWAFRRSSHAR